MNLLILSASTGGGHDMRAFALKEWWMETGYQAKVYHPLEDTGGLYGFGSDLYNFIQRKAPLAHNLYFHFLESAGLHRQAKLLWGKDKFQKVLKGFSPEIVVSMHAHLNHAYYELVQKALPTCKFIIYCGEFSDGGGFSRHWVNPHTDYFTGPFPSTCKAAVKRGMHISKAKPTGLLLRKDFHKKTSEAKKAEILISLGIDPNKPFVLLATGANGANNHSAICKQIINSDVQSHCEQVVTLCSMNEPLKQAVENNNEKSNFKFIALSKVDAKRMSVLLSEAFCVLGRPGAGLGAEAIAVGASMVFNLCGGIMPQERNTLKYWEDTLGGFSSISKPADFSKFLTQKVPAIHESPTSQPQVIPLIRNVVSEDL